MSNKDDLSTFLRNYKKTLSTIYRPVKKTDGIPEKRIEAQDERLGLDIPVALRAYYSVAGKIKGLNQAYNKLYAPEELFLRKNHLVFFEENQGAFCWGIPLREIEHPDPSVFQGAITRQGKKEVLTWYYECDFLSEFLTKMLYWQAVNGGLPHSGYTQGEKPMLDIIVRHWPPIEEHTGLQFFAKNGTVICAMNGQDELSLAVGSTTKKGLDTVAQRLGVSLQV